MRDGGGDVLFVDLAVLGIDLGPAVDGHALQVAAGIDEIELVDVHVAAFGELLEHGGDRGGDGLRRDDFAFAHAGGLGDAHGDDGGRAGGLGGVDSEQRDGSRRADFEDDERCFSHGQIP